MKNGDYHMNIEKIKEDLSVCYLKTIAAVNGIALENITHDEDSVDVIIKKVIQMSSSRRFNSQISVQLKSTSSKSQYNIKENEIIYEFKVKNYNDLCIAATMPSMLALLILSEKEEEWINWATNELMINGKMYWLSLQSNKLTENKDSISIKIPKENILNNVTIEQLIEKAAKEGVL